MGSSLAHTPVHTTLAFRIVTVALVGAAFGFVMSIVGAPWNWVVGLVWWAFNTWASINILK